MARHETDREDLLREATALVQRSEFVLPGEMEPVVIGFRAGGAASVFCGADPVYHFNSVGELRRAYVGGLLYKAEHGRLVELRRERGPDRVQLLRRDLSTQECDHFAQQALARLRGINTQFQSGNWQLRGQVPATGDVMGRIRTWLDGLPERLAIAELPHVR
jgi:hypothetical protein